MTGWIVGKTPFIDLIKIMGKMGIIIGSEAGNQFLVENGYATTNIIPIGDLTDHEADTLEPLKDPIDHTKGRIK